MNADEQGESLKPDIELDYEVIFKDAIPSHPVGPALSVQEQMLAIQQWLQPTDYLSPGSEYQKHLHSHVPGTGSWLPESSAFKEWMTPGRPNCLAIRGVAGCGKSVLAAATIRQLQEAEPDVPVLFFFFRQIVEKNHSARYLIRDFASQLLPHSQDLVAGLNVLRESSRVEGNEHDRVWGTLVDSMHRLEKVYIVVDALDEMDDQDSNIIQKLAWVGSRDGSRAKVLFTSRPIPAIEETLRGLHVSHIRLDPGVAYPDVAKYVTVSMGTLDPTLSPEKEDKVKAAICERAQGLFLHARLMTDTLTEGLKSGRITEVTLPECLDQLPQNLIDAYEEMLKEHSRRSGVSTEQQARILSFVTHASRPLRLIELGSLVARMIGSGDLKEGKVLARASCGRLLEILDDETVSIIHHSFTEFLRDETRASHPGSFPVLDGITAHVMLATVSLQYLNQCPSLDTRSDDPGEQAEDDYNWVSSESKRREQMLQELSLGHPLLPYAIANLSHHISKAGDDHPAVVSALDAFFAPGLPTFSVWIYNNWRSYQSSTLDAIHVASLENWPTYVEHLSAKNPLLLDASDGRGRSPLSYAAKKGHFQIVEYLLNQGARPNSDDRIGFTPMHHAAYNGHADVAKLLIDVGVSPLILTTKSASSYQGHEGKTALQYALEGGHGSLLSMFLPLVPPSEADRCLHWACKSDHLEMVLKTGHANVDSYCGGKTKLFRAAERYDLEAIQLLLKNGADPNRRCDTNLSYEDTKITQTLDCPGGPTAIHAFAGYFGIDYILADDEIGRARQCLQTLISYGAQLDVRADSEEWRTYKGKQEGDLTALHYAVRKQYALDGLSAWFHRHSQPQKILAKLLLEAGADPNARSSFGRNCIHFANPEQPGLIDVLVAGGADVNATDFNGHSPLLALLSPDALRDTKANVEVFMKLIQNGADVSLCSNEGNSALHMVFMSLSQFSVDDIAFLLSLISSRDSFTKTNNSGLVPLLVYKVPKYEFPRKVDSERILEAMIEKGLSMNACDSQGKTILWEVISSRNASLDIMQQFIRLGADPTLRMADGSTLLHHAVRNRVKLNWLSFLARSGVDPTIQDDEGQTPIHLVVKVFSDQPHDGMRFVNALVELGASPTEITKGCQTVLHLASSITTPRGQDNWIDVILKEPMFEIPGPNIPNIYGVTPLHHAAYTSEFTVGKLLQLGADPTCITTEGLSPLHIACIARKPVIVSLLLSCYKEHGVLGKFLNQSPSNITGSPPLHYACRSGCLESVRYLLSNGADPKCRDANGRTPLHALAEWPLECKLWEASSVANGTDLTVLASKWRPHDRRWLRNPTHAAEDRAAEILDLLMEVGIDLKAKATIEDGGPVTALELALSHDFRVLVRKLTSLGVTTAQGGEIQSPNYEDMPEEAQIAHAPVQAQMGKGYEPDRLLVTACTSEEPSLHMIKKLIETTGLDVNGLYGTRPELMATPLHFLASGNHFWQIEALQYVLSRGADVSTLSARGETPLVTAVNSHPPQGFWSAETIQILLAHGSNPNDREVKPNGPGRSCLEISNDARVTKLLLEHGAEPSQSPGVLQEAITHKMDPVMVKYLLQHGVDANNMLEVGKYPLHCAARPRYADHISSFPETAYDRHWAVCQHAVMKTLLEYGANPLKKYDDGRHILQACIEEHGITDPILKAEELDIESKGRNGQTALISACIPSLPPFPWRARPENLQRKTPHPEAALALLKRGAAVDALDDTGRSALHWLCTFEDEPFGATHKELLAALVTAKASPIHVADGAGWKPLHLSIRSGQSDAVRYLIEKGSDPSEPDPDGNTCLHHYARRLVGKKAAAAEAMRIFKASLEMGLDINARNGRGETPLQIFMGAGWRSTDRWRDEVTWEGQVSSRRECDMGDLVGNDDDGIWDVFRAAGADWTTRDDEGSGLLHAVAARKIDPTSTQWERNQQKTAANTFKKLMEHVGSDPRLEDGQSRTAIDLAVARGHRDIVALFGDKERDTGGRLSKFKRRRL
ncbi:ankyrin repeat-containing domain protein [Nemania sp. NC0429]|nr:ankyrin repeat-containing domain protein [Nemania sp. NC0429]